MRKRTFKSLLLAGLMAMIMVVVGLPSIPVMANTMTGQSDWSVTFTSANKMESNFKTADLDDVIKGMQPGDNAVITLKVTNANKSTTNWYMENKVLHSLEDRSANNATSGGAYTYKLTYTGPNGKTNVLFDSETIGGENISVAGEGLNEATDSLDEWMFLDELATNKSGQIVLEVGLDGETQGNDYQDTLADLQMNFAVELPQTTTTTGTPGPTTTPSSSTSRRTSVQTGDTNTPILYLILMGVAGIVMLIIAITSMRLRRREKAEAVQTEAKSSRRGDDR